VLLWESEKKEIYLGVGGFNGKNVGCICIYVENDDCLYYYYY
jgi:hypothetical protein